MGKYYFSSCTYNPEAHLCRHLDFSQDQVEKGNQIISDAKLENVSLSARGYFEL